MAIPKVIYQTFKSSNLPFLNKWFINRFLQRNPEYSYEFYDDKRIESFLLLEFGEHIFKAYKRIQIGAAKADFFRYAILYKKGGIYVDVDSNIPKKLNNLILPSDRAIITKEDHGTCYVQWALIYEANHPFLKKAIELILDNIKKNRYKFDVLNLTGPGVYTKAIKQCLNEDPNIPYRLVGIDYEGYLTYKFPFGKTFLYKRGENWQSQQKQIPVLKAE